MNLYDLLVTPQLLPATPHDNGSQVWLTSYAHSGVPCVRAILLASKSMVQLLSVMVLAVLLFIAHQPKQ